MRKLATEYSVEVDNVHKDSWSEIVGNFDDANIYQTWSYDAIRYGRENISHMVLKKNGSIIAASQARIVKIPLIKAGIAYIRWGPLWRMRGNTAHSEVFRQVIRALRNEYVFRRGLVLRIFPLLISDDFDTFIPLFGEEGYTWLPKGRRERTIIIDLNPSLEDLRKGLKKNWRGHLKRAEKDELEIIEGDDDALFEMFVKIYNEMVERKRFVPSTEIEEFRLIQKDLPKELKMRIILCSSNGDICAGLICSAMGQRGISLFSATNDVGMQKRGSYILDWKLIQWLKSNNFSSYDLHGINPKENPGSYSFKTGLSGKNGREVEFLGLFDSYRNPMSAISVKCADFVRKGTVQLKNSLIKRL
jgi:lipid II:glycine glycyltransferase (peptidoglycan interpeptide bridge formation enzyme)